MKSSEGINAVFILEVIGRPKEHLTETLKDLIKNMDGEKGVHVLSKKINDPVLMKDQKDFYTSFAEIEVNVEELIYLMILIFKYMPAHLEIISPENLQLTNTDINDLLNELTRRLHGYDEIARIIQNEKFVLEKKLREVLGSKPLEENALLSVKPKKESKKPKKKK
ncbi:hypothetical protein HYT24_00620 [Candidatus Pacearchaeota archaeon]|nr:hypothetical protein [Candidatus Pacearchaeota archaeon]